MVNQGSTEGGDDEEDHSNFINDCGSSSSTAGAASSSKSDSMAFGESVFFTPGTDIKKVEDKMAEALVRLDSWKRARAEEKRELLVSEIEKAKLSSSPPVNLALNNSTLNNISINSSLGNSSLLNSSAAKVSDANPQNRCE